MLLTEQQDANHRMIWFGACLFLIALFGFNASKVHSSEFTFSERIAEELHAAFQPLNQNNFHEAISITRQFIEKTEPQLFAATSKDNILELHMSLRAASMILAMSLHETQNFEELTDILKRRMEWRIHLNKNEKNKFLQIFDAQLQLNVFLVKIKAGKFSEAVTYLLRAKKIVNEMPPKDYEIVKMPFAFDVLVQMSAALYVQKSGYLPPGENWLKTFQGKQSEPLEGTIILAYQIMKSIGLARVGQLDKATDLIDQLIVDVGESEPMLAVGYFHKGCILAAGGNVEEGLLLLKRAEFYAKKAGIFLPISGLFPKPVTTSTINKWPSTFDPRTKDYFLKIIPGLKMNLHFNYEIENSPHLPSSFESEIAPSVFVNFSN